MAGDLDVEGTKTLSDGSSTQTIDGTYDPTAWEVTKTINEQIEAGEGSLTCDIVMPMLWSEYSDCTDDIDYNGDWNKDLIVKHTYNYPNRYYTVVDVLLYSIINNTLKNIKLKWVSTYRYANHTSYNRLSDKKLFYVTYPKHIYDYNYGYIMSNVQTLNLDGTKRDVYFTDGIAYSDFPYTNNGIKELTWENGEKILFWEKYTRIDRDNSYTKGYLFFPNKTPIYIGYTYSHYAYGGGWYIANNWSKFIPISNNSDYTNLNSKLHDQLWNYDFAFIFFPAKAEKPYIGIIKDNVLEKYYFDVPLKRWSHIWDFFKVGNITADNNGLLITKNPDHKWGRNDYTLTPWYIMYLKYTDNLLNLANHKVNNLLYEDKWWVIEYFAFAPLNWSVNKLWDHTYIISLGIWVYKLDTSSLLVQTIWGEYKYRVCYFYWCSIRYWISDSSPRIKENFLVYKEIWDYILIDQWNIFKNERRSDTNYKHYVVIYNKTTGSIRTEYSSKNNDASLIINLWDKFYINYYPTVYIYDAINNTVTPDTNPNWNRRSGSYYYRPMDYTYTSSSYNVKHIWYYKYPRRSSSFKEYYNYIFKYFKNTGELKFYYIHKYRTNIAHDSSYYDNLN